jgi:hypothetical protein
LDATGFESFFDAESLFFSPPVELEELDEFEEPSEEDFSEEDFSDEDFSEEDFSEEDFSAAAAVSRLRRRVP